LTLNLELQAGQVVRIEATKDNSIVLVDGEEHANAGRQNAIRIKGNQHLVAMDFDFEKLRGKRLSSATLVCHQVDQTISGVTISTIQADWDEYQSCAFTSGKQEFTGWAWNGAWFPAVTGGNSHSLVCQTKSTIKDNAYHWQIDPDLIHANIIGAAYGLTIHEFDCDYTRNPRICSHEQKGREPYILIEFGGEEPKPQAASELKIVDDGDPESLRLQLRGPKSGFAYEVRMNAQPLPRWNIPFVKPGQFQEITIRDITLAGGETIEIEVITLNRLGEKSKPARIAGYVPVARSNEIPPVPQLHSAGHSQRDIAVIPALDKYDANGTPVGHMPADYLWRNEVYNGQKITLSAAKGEVTGFQVLLKGSALATVKCELPGIRTEMWRALYVESEKGLIPDPLVPLDNLVLSENTPTPVVVDIFVPFEHQTGIVDGTLQISDGREIPIELKVRNFAIPAKASFACEMNSYGMPDKAAEFYELQRIAYDHRVHCNILHYSHNTAAPGARKCNLDMLMADGRRMNEKRYNDIQPGAGQAYWDDFVMVFGPYLSGTNFSDQHRGPIAAPGFYLTFHESWPLNVRAYFNGNPDTYEAFKEKPEYAQTFVDIVRDFVRVAKEQRWTDAGFQIYLNNKGSLDDAARSPWVLDEPESYWDYRALAYYADLVRQARGNDCPIKVQHRIDISRPEFDRGQLWGKADLWVVSTDAMKKYQRIIADRVRQTGEQIWVYGTTNRVEESNRQTQAWALWAYLQGAKGLVPWQTVDKTGRALRTADQLGLFVFDRQPDGYIAIRHSLRLKAYRQAEQDIEYLELLRQKLKWTDGQIRRFVDAFLRLNADIVRRSDAAAGTARYENIGPEAFRRMRESAATLLEQ
jgi:hypothetical protein